MQEVMQYSVQYTNSGLHSRVDDTDIDTVSGESGLWVSVCCPHCLHSLECSSDEDGLGATLEAIACLPPPNKDTLAFLILHLQRVAAQHQANKMPMVSLAKVFGPTIVVPESPFLGSCQSPRSRARPPHMARLEPTPVTNRTRRAGNFFAPLN